jgi:hypothetical protein
LLRLLTALVLGFCLAACSSSSTAPSPPPCCGVTVPFVPGQSFSVNPTSVLFDNQMVSTTSAPRTVAVANTGDTPQPVRGRMNGGNFAEFAQTNDCPSMIAVGASCTFNITFTPSGTGWRGGSLIFDGLNEEEGFVNVGGTGTNYMK